MMHGTDEIEVNLAEGRTEKVIGARKKGPQYLQRDGTRENITVIVTISSDRTCTPPATWEGGPLCCMAGYSSYFNTIT